MQIQVIDEKTNEIIATGSKSELEKLGFIIDLKYELAYSGVEIFIIEIS